MQDSRMLKAITWRILASMATIAIFYFYTRELYLSFGLGGFDLLIKFALYYLHERGWNAVAWGKERKGRTSL